MVKIVNFDLYNGGGVGGVGWDLQMQFFPFLINSMSKILKRLSYLLTKFCRYLAAAMFGAG